MPAASTDVANACRKLEALTAGRGGPVGMLIQLALDDAVRFVADTGRGDLPTLLNEFRAARPAPVQA